MADALKGKFQIVPELIEGAGGVFDVSVDAKLIYSKAETGRFPEHQEIFDLVQPLVRA